MATRSICKHITINDNYSVHVLISALEDAQKSKPKDIIFSRTFSEVPKEKIKDIF